MLIKDAIKSGDDIRISNVNKMAEILEMCLLDYGEYPENLSELTGIYVDEKSRFIKKKFLLQ
ncbi:MAG: hypothetical protein ABIE43_03950 [Patescibacteria group bacterium]